MQSTGAMQDKIVDFLIAHQAEVLALAQKTVKMKAGGFSEAEKEELAKDASALVVKFFLGM